MFGIFTQKRTAAFHGLFNEFKFKTQTKLKFCAKSALREKDLL